MKGSGKIIVLAYPDTFVTMSDEWICRFLPLVGLGTREHIKAGHAALVLIEDESGEAGYYDFGRYVTPDGYGRVRGANTDVELEIPFRATINAEGNLQNLNEFLCWLDANPHKTHGEGRLIASVCNGIDFKKSKVFIDELQSKGSIPYGAFNSKGSNCSRFVTDAILAGTDDVRIIRALRFNKLFTPSTVGNVEKAAASPVYEVYNGEVKEFESTAFKENLRNYFDKKRTDKGVLASGELPPSAQKLSGTGSDAWFVISNDNLPPGHFRIKRFNEQHEVDHDGVFVTSQSLDLDVPYEFTYDSHCELSHVLQKDQKIKLEKVSLFKDFSSSQTVRSA